MPPLRARPPAPAPPSAGGAPIFRQRPGTSAPATSPPADPAAAHVALSHKSLSSSIASHELPEDGFKCRHLPALYSLGRLCARGERGVALVGDRAGKVVILDVEGDDDEEEDDEDSGGDGSDDAGSAAEEGEDDGEGEWGERSQESSGADMSTTSNS